MIDWLQITTAFLTLGLYTTFVCYFFYHLNEKSIEKLETKMEKSIEKIEERMEKSESHWREMFMYMSGRIDNIGKGMTPDVQTQKNPP